MKQLLYEIKKVFGQRFFVLIAAVCTIVFKVIGQELLSQVTGLGLCLIVTLYWISFLILRKKY